MNVSHACTAVGRTLRKHNCVNPEAFIKTFMKELYPRGARAWETQFAKRVREGYNSDPK